MEYKDFLYFIQNVGKDPSRLIFEDELTGIYNRRYLLNYLQYKVSWDALDSHPVSLIMLDLDHFKQINDTHGHEAGDQALIWVAGLLREVGGEKGLPVRFAGDEFMILMPRVDKQVALQVGERLRERVREKPVKLEEMEGEFSITLSIGVASAPDDAQTSKDLIHQADTALYFAKKSGRDQVANAGLVDPHAVFDKTALHQLDKATIAGRQTQLATVSEALKKFSQGQSQFLIVEGAAGMGKSEFLGTIRQSLSPGETWQITANGISQELFRPYYLTTNILIDILNQLSDKGVGVLESLSPKEIGYLSHILPQLGEPDNDSKEDNKAEREGIFNTLLHFIPKILEDRPLILLIDDLHFSDEATLILLRRLILVQDFRLLIIASSTDTSQDKVEGQPAPLARFYATYCKELDILKVSLTPLTAANIAEHLKSIFPQVRLPENFERNLAQTCQGNPLFLSEIVRKLVQDRKITLVGNQWVAEPLEDGYLPRSLEEIVSQKIAALDEESRHLLDQASTFGENVPLSMLSGSSEQMEAKVLEFVDQAVDQGLLSSEFQMNDETIRFLSKRILDITYGAMQEDRKQELHEQVGTYQEVLYEQRLIPSAASLAYHFKRSTNQEKAGNYEQLQTTTNNRIFNAAEAIYYTGKRTTEAAPEVSPLDKDSLPLIPTVLRSLLLVVRNLKLYPPGSKAIVTANRQVKEVIDKFFEKNELLSFFGIKQALIVNGQRIDVTEYKYFAESFLKLLNRLDLKGISFKKGLTEEELRVLLEAFGRVKQDMLDQDFWQRFSTEQRFVHIELTQVRYTVVTDSADQAQIEQIADGEDGVIAVDISAQLADAEQGLDAADLKDLPEVMRCLLNAARSIKLYPLKSKAITTAIGQLLQSLERILERKPALTLARVGNALLVNGEKIDTSDYGTLVQTVVKFLSSLSLTSLSFLAGVSADDLKIFIGALDQLPTVGLDVNYWLRLGQDNGLTTILFDQRVYEARVSPTRLASREVGVGTGTAKVLRAVQPAESEAAETLEALEGKMPLRMSDLLLKGDETQIKQIIKRLFQEYLQGSLQTRQKVVNQCNSLLEGLNLGLRNQLAKLLAGPLLTVFSQEKDPVIIRELATLLHRLTTTLLHFAEYPWAGRILLHLHRRHGELLKGNSDQAALLKKIILRPLEPKTQQLLMEDFRSGEPGRQQNAAQLLGTLGPQTLPLLIHIIKNEENLRIRQMAATLVAEQGSEAAKLLKREFVLQTKSDARVRILEVIDSVTRDLKTELAYGLDDDNIEVHQAALQLAERLNDAQVEKLLLEYVDNDKVHVAVAAIKALGKLKSKAAIERFISVLQSAKDGERLIACCQSLGLIADPACIEPLARLLESKGFFKRKRHSAEVRATAALALAQIKHPRVAQMLTQYTEDSDPRIRQIASTYKLSPTASPKKNAAVAE
ncbi:MAG: diguanylate cyclase [Syntrophobacterales bacterium]|jgi:diguanylate cyclase (GGDEF)-like protein